MEFLEDHFTLLDMETHFDLLETQADRMPDSLSFRSHETSCLVMSCTTHLFFICSLLFPSEPKAFCRISRRETMSGWREIPHAILQRRRLSAANEQLEKSSSLKRLSRLYCEIIIIMINIYIYIELYNIYVYIILHYITLKYITLYYIIL